MHIRRATPEDAAALVAFNQAMAMETEERALDGEVLTSGVTGLLSHAERGFYLVAEAEGEIAGSLMVTFEWSDWRNATFWWIQSVYVKPNMRRKGIYKGLYREVQRLAEATEDVCGYRLYVEKDNEIAQRTYESLGMQESYYLMYESKS